MSDILNKILARKAEEIGWLELDNIRFYAVRKLEVKKIGIAIFLVIP